MTRETHLQKPPAGKLLLRTLIAAVGAAILNNLYSMVYTAVTGVSIPDVINAFSVTLFSAVPVILGGLVYLLASRFSVKIANIGLAVGTVVLFVLLTIPSFGETVTSPAGSQPAPEGFT
ncbi:MAG: hypothetical protein ACOC28_07045, partial [Alkalispirochaetaceae bacterium]